MRGGDAPERARRAAAFAAALTLAASAAEAQYNKTEPPKARFRVGPLRFNPRLELRHAGRDSNVFLDPTNPLADTSVVVRGSAEGFVRLGRRTRLFGKGWLDWGYFQSLSSERSTDPGGEGRAEIDIGPFTFVGGGGGLEARQLYSIDIDERILRQEQWAHGGAEWRLTRRFMASGGAEYRSYRYDPSARTSSGNPFAAASLNRNNLTATLALRYKLTSMTTAVATGDVIQDEFQLRAPGLDTTRSYRYLAGFELNERAFITGKFLGGFREFPTATSGSLPSYRGPAVSAELVMPILGRLRLIGSLLRDVYLSSTAVRSVEERARNSYVFTQLQGSADIDLPLELIGRATVGYSEARYLLPTTLGGVVFPRAEHLYSAGGSLLRRFSDSLRVGGSVTYYRRVSTLPGNSYERWVYGVSAELMP